MKEHIFNGQFNNNDSTDLSSTKHVTLLRIQEFIITESST